MTLVKNIILKTNRDIDKPLNILTCPTHERYETGLTKTNHNFYAIRSEGIKDWYTTYAPVPKNYILLDKDISPTEQIPRYVDFDLVLSQNKNGQFPVLSMIAKALQIPLVTLEHTMPFPDWNEESYKEISKRYGDINVFISDYSKNKWQEINIGEIKNSTVINHFIDTDTFKYKKLERKNHILSVANDYINRQYCLNYNQYKKVTNGLPTFPVGDTKGLSEKAKSTEELVNFYNTSKVFINTAHVSPIPMSLLEAMACGNICVSCNTCAIPEYIQHGYNGFLADTDEEMRLLLEDLLNRKEEDLEEIRQNAVNTILEKCRFDNFINSWNQVFYNSLNLT